MRIELDEELCTGHGRCYAVAPELFEPDDDDGHGVLLHGNDVPAGMEDAARKAAANCPERAIRVNPRS